MSGRFQLAVHGGAGTLRRSKMTSEREVAYHAGLRAALDAGGRALERGAGALDAVVEAVCVLEDEPLFNAGRGAVFTSAGRNEMDAAVMEGAGRRAGAVAGLSGPRNPVKAALAVLREGEHVILAGHGAADLARRAGLHFEDEAYFFTQGRRDALDRLLSGERSEDPAARHGTVGAVARDRNGHLAAATSTGGMTGKAPGRIGDTPVPGAGTFADNATCAVSATGHGEVFLRYQAAAEIAARMRYAGEGLSAAAEAVVMDLLAKNDGSGGLIAVDGAGNVAMPFNCAGMYRGCWREGEAPFTAIYR